MNRSFLIIYNFGKIAVELSNNELIKLSGLRKPVDWLILQNDPSLVFITFLGITQMAKRKKGKKINTRQNLFSLVNRGRKTK